MKYGQTRNTYSLSGYSWSACLRYLEWMIPMPLCSAKRAKNLQRFDFLMELPIIILDYTRNWCSNSFREWYCLALKHLSSSKCFNCLILIKPLRSEEVSKQYIILAVRSLELKPPKHVCFLLYHLDPARVELWELFLSFFHFVSHKPWGWQRAALFLFLFYFIFYIININSVILMSQNTWWVPLVIQAKQLQGLCLLILEH